MDILKLIPLLAFSFFASPAPAKADATIIAKVGDSEVKADDIKPLIEKLPVRDQLLLSKDPAALNNLVRELIVQQLVFKEALSKKWEQQPQIVSQLERIRQQAITQSYLQSLATPPADYPSQSDLEAAYDTLKNGDFATAAKSLSDDKASAQRGGEIGSLGESQIQPEIRSAVSSLSKGGTTEPIRMNDGYHIIRVLEVKEPYTATLDEVKVPLTNELRSQRAQVIAKEYLAKLLQQNPVTLNEIEVSKLIDAKAK
jgi:PPIC-type PPIASE domain